MSTTYDLPEPGDSERAAYWQGFAEGLLTAMNGPQAPEPPAAPEKPVQGDTAAPQTPPFLGWDPEAELRDARRRNDDLVRTTAHLGLLLNQHHRELADGQVCEVCGTIV